MGGVQVHFHAVDHGMEIGGRHAETTDGVMKSRMKRMAIGSFQRFIKPSPPCEQKRTLFLGRSGTVGEVVGHAHEGIQGAHRPPLVGRQQAKGMIEVAGLAPGQSFAVGVRARQF